MARGANPTKGGYMDSAAYADSVKRKKVESGVCVWMILVDTGEGAAVINDPGVIARKKLQGFAEADVIEEVVKRPVIRAAAPKAEPKAEPQKPKSSGKGGE